mmetsp:Transcript_6442/g.6369  ORF Transcript_6442/g.6369 Transcript_6442/m.6369 type:complete len:83 (+) Transcript_6442:89-337(+)
MVMATQKGYGFDDSINCIFQRSAEIKEVDLSLVSSPGIDFGAMHFLISHREVFNVTVENVFSTTPSLHSKPMGLLARLPIPL